ncbi:MAG TPA: helical backbone metal receptor [Planctomycetota bacterium]
MPRPPQRIVSLVPSTTESVCELGARSRLVACTRYCTEPAAPLASVPRVGGTKNPSREQVMLQQPDLVLCNAEENRPEDIEWLQSRVPVLVQTPRTVIEAAACLRALAERLDLLEAARPWLLRIEAQLAAAGVESLRRRPLRVFYAIWRKPWMSVNRDTYIHDVLRITGCANVCADEAVRYPEVTPEAIAALGVDLVLLPSEPWEFDAEQLAELRSARTFAAARLELCDGRDYCWHGVRMADGLGRALASMTRLGGDCARR